MDRDAIADLFAAFGPIHARRMFSGFGLYSDGVCFAMCLRDDIFLKADATTIPQFEAEGCAPFSYDKQGRSVSVGSFWRMPARLYDDPDDLAHWTRAAVGAALRAKLKKGTGPGRAKAAASAAPRRRTARRTQAT
jgi:DNA transformation protein